MIKDRECISTESRKVRRLVLNLTNLLNDVAQPLGFCLGAKCITVLADGSVTVGQHL